ncbi:ElaB/YqjD/DUF883 family membrane-anchored ribosome-binding protein [Pseudorhizobium tarimense]|uniref:ElaB/YqjD/DUF883 family membrane-anchored ribosome-binding protein n=1 Tax=Pseudorhizobium tarimense TaxID=1079109 RepID=A0ABV2H1Y4_9HYPH|nr:hypothetical protein [Pseudorhizobium tarimense]MCJ8517854.1 hypothetical protein [Pseudorhizobium tarimense]
MAETTGSVKPLGSTEQDQSEQVGREIASLRTEIAALRERLSERAGSAATYLQEEANSVAGAIREHPATATTLFTLVGAVGFAIGYLVGAQSVENRSAWYRRYY